MDDNCLEETATLEAELEAEIERMQICFDDAIEWFSCFSEDRLDTANAVQEEVSLRHVSGNLIAPENSAVPPVELAKRLYKVQEVVQQEKIMELEAEIKRLDAGLQAEQQRFQAWKGSLRHLLQGLSSLQDDLNIDEEDTHSKEESFGVAGLGCSVSLRPHGEHTSLLQNVGDVFRDGKELYLKHSRKTESGLANCLKSNGLLRDEDEQSSRNLRIIMSEPEIVDVSYDSVSSPSSYTAISDILGSASSDKVTKNARLARNDLEIGVEGKTTYKQDVLRIGGFWCDAPYTGTKLSGKNGDAGDAIETCDYHRQCYRKSCQKTSRDHWTYSGLDEQLDQLLIKRIVQKGRKGMLMVEAAELTMSSFEIENSTS